MDLPGKGFNGVNQPWKDFRLSVLVSLLLQQSLIFFRACELRSYYGSLLVEQGILDALAMFWEKLLRESIQFEIAVIAIFFGGGLERSANDTTTECKHDLLLLWF
jgi:hypothetical protein